MPVTITSGNLGSEAPSIAVQGEAALYVMYAKGDGQIYMNNFRGGVWSGEEMVTSAGFNSYPSVRWSYYYNPSDRKSQRLDYVWTSLAGTVSSVQYAWAAIPNFNPTEKGTAVQTSYLLAGMAIAGVSVLIIIYKRPWPEG